MTKWQWHFLNQWIKGWVERGSFTPFAPCPLQTLQRYYGAIRHRRGLRYVSALFVTFGISLGIPTSASHVPPTSLYHSCRLHRPPVTCLADVWRNSARCDDDNSRLSHLFISLMSIAFLSFFWLLNVKRGILGHLSDFKNGNRTTFYREAYILYYIYPQYTFSRFDQHFSRFVSAFSILFRNFATEIINNLSFGSAVTSRL